MVRDAGTQVDSILTNRQSVPPAAMRRLMREIVELKNSPPEGVRIITSEDNMLDVTGIIEGPGEHSFLLFQYIGG